MTIKRIQKKLNNMTKSQLERVCRKIKCSKGTKKQMIVNLLRPFTKNKYRMSDSDKLMKKNGTWTSTSYDDGPHGDSAQYSKLNLKPCCSKCQQSLWDTITFNIDAPYYCSPCKKTDDGYEYNSRSIEVPCSPPEPEQS